MLRLLTALLFGSMVLVSKADYYQYNFTMEEFSNGVLRDAIALFTKGLIADFVGCPNDVKVDRNNIRFWLWTKGTPVNIYSAHPKKIDGSKKVIFMTTGWLSDVTSDGRFLQLKDAYLQRYQDANIIGVEWTTYAVDLYANSFCYIPKIAPIVAEFICNLKEKLSVDFNKVHMIGHSLGGQMCGLVGQETQIQCKEKIGRITALDPAGPLYQTISESRRLDASDAKIVDVIHTNQGQAGFFGSCGTADYYPNCGYFQPGCLKLDVFNISTFFNFPLSAISCSHHRSTDYLIESILSDKFIARSCTNCPGIPPMGPCIVDLFSIPSVMGENYPDYQGRGTSNNYYLATNSKWPFGRG